MLIATVASGGGSRCRYRDHIQEVLATLDGDFRLQDGVWWLVPRAAELDRAALAAAQRAQRASEAVAAIRARGRWRRAVDRHAMALSLQDLEMLLIGHGGLTLQVPPQAGPS